MFQVGDFIEVRVLWSWDPERWNKARVEAVGGGHLKYVLLEGSVSPGLHLELVVPNPTVRRLVS